MHADGTNVIVGQVQIRQENMRRKVGADVKTARIAQALIGVVAWLFF